MMKAIRWMPVLLLAIAAHPARSADPPPKAPHWERSLAVGGQGYFPVALRLADGRIAAVLRGGAPHVGVKGRLDMIFSSDEGKTWTPPAVVVDSPADDRNPALGQARDGTLVAGFWRTATYNDEGRYDPKLDKPRGTWVTRSSDAGRTWDEPAAIDVSEFGWGSPFGKILTLPDGGMLMAIYGGSRRKPGGKSPNPNEQDHSYLFRSADNGRTWKYYAEIGDGKQELNETALLRLSSGRLMAAARSGAGEVWLSGSGDEGRTWSAPVLLTPRSVHPADLVELEDGRVLMVVGNRAGPLGVLGMVSDKNQKFDWARRFTLVDDAVNGDCGYPSSVTLPGGRALTLYYATGVKEHPEWETHCGAVAFNLP